MNIVSDFQIRINQILSSKEPIINNTKEENNIQKSNKKEKGNYTIKDFLEFSNNDVKKILKTIDIDILSAILFNAQEKLKNKIISNLSKPRLKDLNFKLSLLKSIAEEEVKEYICIFEEHISNYMDKLKIKK
jgi:flagellar motor switch protein FliG